MLSGDFLTLSAQEIARIDQSAKELSTDSSCVQIAPRPMTCTYGTECDRAIHG